METEVKENEVDEIGLPSCVCIGAVSEWVAPSAGVAMVVAFGGRCSGARRFRISCLEFSNGHGRNQTSTSQTYPITQHRTSTEPMLQSTAARQCEAAC